MDDFMVIREIARRKYIQIKKKLYEVVRQDDVTVNWKLEGSILSQIIPGSRYKPSEVFQLHLE